MHDAIMVGIGTAMNDDPQLNSTLIASDVRRVLTDFLSLSASCTPSSCWTSIHPPYPAPSHTGHKPASPHRLQTTAELQGWERKTTLGGDITFAA